MSNDMIAWLGIFITIVVGVGGFVIAKKVNSKKQIQKVDRSGTAYQAGRDINVGGKNE
jgi:hypothetical protein